MKSQKQLFRNNLCFLKYYVYFCTCIIMMLIYLLNRSRITTSKRCEQKNIHWERALNGADFSHSIFGLW